MTTAGITVSGGGAGNSPRRSLEAPSPRYGEKTVKVILAACAGLSVLVTTGIVLSLLSGAADFFREVPIHEFLFGTTWAPAFADAHFGVIPIVTGTLNIVFWALVVSIPLGLLSAIYLSEYAPNRVRKTIKPMLEVLEGIPTVAIGLFALMFLRPFLEDVFPFLDWTGPHAIGVAGVAVGLLIVPLVASISDDAMRSVPRGLREGAYALGASKLRVSARVVFPAAISGIVAAIVLAVSRAIGETMVVLMAAGARPQITFDPTKSAQTMTAFIGQTATGEISFGTIAYYTIFAVGALLFVMTLVMNLFAVRLVRRFREVYE
ncbi:phosphate ABC transporter permease subunit PstC [Phytoactinopolyspora alkaliphila]|uniref:Phosphate transport system permease protein n=1 Tax=Phytoactinopolyspora alkaliphila TaxID=1783498 RepID=A0A6N9YLS2_9ACTN|nr:phosphate ABC transporter permease subunit PstC [Phytoactinopolyspora alkaliphila]NED95976.1 phosphate ABC transporter permease subunit PstC [Phytoactinopolyspora alkaliphila]